jgi:hypothetical protein
VSPLGVNVMGVPTMEAILTDIWQRGPGRRKRRPDMKPALLTDVLSIECTARNVWKWTNLRSGFCSINPEGLSDPGAGANPNWMSLKTETGSLWYLLTIAVPIVLVTGEKRGIDLKTAVGRLSAGRVEIMLEY